MEGYSVTEAASVLGVPTERVWELLARGVLSGAPDGDTGMRVFLQPRPAPPVVEDAPPSNGHGRSPDPAAEASPFRELLTEFRNLTERYGQALLALGEARGEVASLRSRVDVLEARMDLRLPMSPPTPTIAGPMPWDASPRAAEHRMAPAPPRSTAPPAPGASDELAPSPPVEVVDRDAERGGRRRRKGQRRATEAFAEALARAQDPNPADLPESADVLAAGKDRGPDESGEGGVQVDAALPRELPAADAIAVADIDLEVPPTVSRPEAEPEPEPERKPEPAAPEPAAPEPEPAAPEPAEPVPAEPVPTEPAPGQVEPAPEARSGVVVDSESPTPDPPSEPGPAAAVEPDEPVQGVRVEPVGEAVQAFGVTVERAPEHEPVLAPQSGAEPEPFPEGDALGRERQSGLEPRSDVTAEPGPEPESRTEPPTASEPVPEQPPDSPGAGEPAFDHDRYTTRIDEPDWWTPEESRENDAHLPPETVSSTADAAPSTDRPAEVRAESVPPTVESPQGGSRAGEETMLWFGRQPDSSDSLDPSEDDAAAEMEVVSTGRQTAQVADPGPLPGSTELDEAMVALDEQTHRWQPPAATTQPDEPSRLGREPLVSRGPAGGPTAASRAYRRLRRIFP